MFNRQELEASKRETAQSQAKDTALVRQALDFVV